MSRSVRRADAEPGNVTSDQLHIGKRRRPDAGAPRGARALDLPRPLGARAARRGGQKLRSTWRRTPWAACSRDAYGNESHAAPASTRDDQSLGTSRDAQSAWFGFTAMGHGSEPVSTQNRRRFVSRP